MRCAPDWLRWARMPRRGGTRCLLRSQLRLDEDGRWWLFTADDELGWVLSSESADDPTDLI